MPLIRPKFFFETSYILDDLKSSGMSKSSLRDVDRKVYLPVKGEYYYLMLREQIKEQLEEVLNDRKR